MNFKKTLQRPYLFWVISIALFYITLNIFISKFYLTIFYAPYFLDTINWNDFLLSIGFTLVIGILVAINIVTAYLHYQENKQHLQSKSCTAKDKTATVFASFGAFIGLATGVCSACTPIILPFLFSIFGVTLTWSSLPISGFHVQAVLALLLSLNLYYFQWHENRKQEKKEEKIQNKQGG